MVAFFSKFIPHFAELCEFLYALKRKRVKVVKSSTTQRSFDLLKEALVSPSVLAQNGRPIVFAARILNATERNYSITERQWQ